MSVITDREIQLARERLREGGSGLVADMLDQLLDFRRYGRVAVAEHDFRQSYNAGISELVFLVRRCGCQWSGCDQPATTPRVQRRFPDVVHLLCQPHADRGEAKGLWLHEHHYHARWVREDQEQRARDEKGTGS